MADLSYNVKVNTSDATRSITGLRTALGGLAAAFSIRETVQFADSITNLQNKLRTISTSSQDVANQFAAIAQIANSSRSSLDATGDLFFKIARSLDTLGISQREAAVLTDSISKGLILSGASAAGAESAIYQLGQAFGAGVLRGEELNAVLENAPVLATVLADSLGVSVGELRKLGEQGKLTGDQVAQAFIRANGTLNESFGKTVPTISQSFTVMKNKLAEVMDRFEQDTNLFQNLAKAIISLGDGVVALTNFYKENAEGIKAIVKVLGTLLGAYLLIEKGVKGVQAAQSALIAVFGLTSKSTGLWTGIIKGAERSAINFGKALGLVSIAGGKLTRVGSAIAGIGAALRVLLRFGGVVGIIMAVAQAVDYLLKKFLDFSAIDWVLDKLRSFGEWAGIISSSTKQLSTENESAAETSRLLGAGLSDVADRSKLAAAAQKELNDALAAARKETLAQVEAYQSTNAQLLERINHETRLVGLTEEQQYIINTLKESETAYLQGIAPLLERIIELRRYGNAEEQRVIPELEAGIRSMTEAYRAQLPELEAAIAARIKATEADKQAQAIAKARLETEKTITEFQLQGQRKIQQAYDEMELSRFSGLQRTLKEIELEERRLADAARDRVQEQFGNNDPSGLKSAMDEITRSSNEIIRQRQAATAALIQEQRTFASGWRNAWAEYADNATNASQHAANVFRTATKGMEDALVGFVKTGKFEWRGFVSDILEQLLRAQIQQGIASLGESLGLDNLFGTKGGAQGGGSGRGGSPTAPLFVQDVSAVSGLAGGGVIAQQQAAMAQQSQSMFSRMGEIMSSIGTYLSSAMGSIGKVISSLVGSLGSIMGSVMKGMGSALSSIGSMIMSLIRSIVSMFGGYFADGGVLPRGQFGIVGERGPEIITGPATVTPMSGIGGGTQVIYNINAVDARSFQQLLAQDPGLIFALTEQGRKSLAGSRR